MQTEIWIRTTFQGFHRWKDAPEDVAFLRAFHRHVFHVRVGMEVDHANRQIEFFQFKRKVDAFLKNTYEEKEFELSCEQLATNILNIFGASWVEVSEDGENGAVVHRLKRS